MKTEGISGLRHRVVISIAWSLAAFPADSIHAAPEPVFHLSFSEFEDVSESGLDIVAGDSVTLNPEGGPTLEGSGVTLHSAVWEGLADDTHQILIPDNDVLDEVAVGPGSIVTWIKVADETEWNNICKTIEPAFTPSEGIEFQTNQPSGVFGAVQGWNGNNFGPAHDTNGGPGGSETPSGVWTHCALVWTEDGDHTIYVNGVPGVTVPEPGFGINMPGDWTIGGDSCCAGDRQLRGELADFAIYNETLTPDDLVEIMEEGVSPPPPEGAVFLRGDTDGNGALELTDPIVNLTFQFIGGTVLACMDAADFDDSGTLEITDPIANLSRQFAGGEPAPAPGSASCGLDPTEDELTCAAYPEESCP
jgi:hypothetical protein